jgi:hypothetical protein
VSENGRRFSKLRPPAESIEVTTHERERLAALHEYGLIDAPAGDEPEAVVPLAGRR